MTTEEQALALVNEVARELGWGETKEIFAAGYTRNEALFRAIEQHEAFRQEVSDVAEEVVQRQGKLQALLPFILPAPKPDPLVEVFMDARGLEIREKGQ